MVLEQTHVQAPEQALEQALGQAPMEVLEQALSRPGGGQPAFDCAPFLQGLGDEAWKMKKFEMRERRRRLDGQGSD